MQNRKTNEKACTKYRTKERKHQKQMLFYKIMLKMHLSAPCVRRCFMCVTFTIVCCWVCAHRTYLINRNPNFFSSPFVISFSFIRIFHTSFVVFTYCIFFCSSDCLLTCVSIVFTSLSLHRCVCTVRFCGVVFFHLFGSHFQPCKCKSVTMNDSTCKIYFRLVSNNTKTIA